MKSDLWSYRIGGIEFGPVEFEQLCTLAQSGQLSANDEVRSGCEKWMSAGDIVGLIPDAPSGEYAFSLPDPSRDRRQRDSEPTGRSESKTSNRTSSSRRARGGRKPEARIASPLTSGRSRPEVSQHTDDINSLISAADQVTSDDFALSAVSESHGHLSPQRGIRTSSPDNTLPRIEERRPDPTVTPNAERTTAKDNATPDFAVRGETPQTQTISASQTGDQHVQTPAPSIHAPAALNSFATGSPPAARRHPVIPQSKRRASIAFDSDVLIKFGASAAVVILVGLGVTFGPGLFGPSSEVTAVATLKETDNIVRQVLSLEEFTDTGSRPDRFLDRICQQAKVLEIRIEQQANPELLEPIQQFHRTELATVLAADGWTAENLSMVSSRWQEVRSKVLSGVTL